MPSYAMWKVIVPVLGNVALEGDLDGIEFRRVDDKRFATTLVKAPQEYAIDVALAKVTRALDRLALIYDEGLSATKRGAIAEWVEGPRRIQRNAQGRICVTTSFANLQIDLLKDDRHRDSTLMEGIRRLRPEKEAILDRMVSYYNKGLRAMDSDPFNAFLSFWGCLETYMRSAIKRDPRRSDFIRFLQELNIANKEAKELHGRYRSAIAHASYDPSAPDEVGSVAAKVQSIKGLARQSIDRLLWDAKITG